MNFLDNLNYLTKEREFDINNTNKFNIKGS